MKMEKMDLRDAKEVKRKVEEVTKKRKPAQPVQKVEQKKKTQKAVKKPTKKEKEKQKKFKKFIIRLIIIEYLIFALFLSITNQIKMYRENERKTLIIENQQNTINMLSKTYEDCLEPIFEGDTIKIIHNQFKAPKKAYNITEEERELIAQLLYHEARGESLECQKAVVSVIFNRLQSGTWGDTLKEVIYAQNQFEPVLKGLLPNTKPLQAQYDAIDYVLETGTTLPSWVQYFRASYHFGWQDYTQYKAIDNTYFGGFEE